MTAILGLLLGLVAGVMTGSFSLPMKKTTRWSWEATWMIWSVCALFIIPWLITMITVPDVLEVFARASTTDMVLVFVFGVGWGLGAVFFGQSIAMIGISLAFALCIGLATALGSLIPMLRNPRIFITPGGMWSSVGIAIMIVGVSICAAAGRHKDEFRISNFWAWHVNQDIEVARREARRELVIRGWLAEPWLQATLSDADARVVQDNMEHFLKAYREKTGFIDGVPDRIVDRLIDQLSCTGDLSSVDEQIDKLKVFASGGFTEIALRVHDDPYASIQLIGEQVVPAVS